MTTTTTPPGPPTATPSAAAARTDAVTKIYGEGETQVTALDHVDVTFERGRFTAISGAGHYAHEETPAQVNDHLQRFLAAR